MPNALRSDLRHSLSRPSAIYQDGKGQAGMPCSEKKKMAITLTQTGLQSGLQHSCLVMLSGSFLEMETKLTRLWFLDSLFPNFLKAGTTFVPFSYSGAWLSLCSSSN